MKQILTRWRSEGSLFQYKNQSVFYRRTGEGSAVVAIHGYPLSSWDWSFIWEALSYRHELIAADMLGFGFSDKPRKYEYSIFDHADMHEALLCKLKKTDVHILAHDLGVSVAQELLARFEDGKTNLKIRSLCFLNGGLFAEAYQPRIMQKILSSPFGRFIGPRIPKKLFRKSMSEVFGPENKPTDDELETYWQIVNCNDGLKVTHLVGRFILERIQFRDRWVNPMLKTKVPMRFINAPYDPNSGLHMAKRYQALIPQPDVVLLDETIGHWPQIEAPAATSKNIIAFYEKCENTEREKV